MNRMFFSFKIFITARIRRMGEGNIFSFLSIHTQGGVSQSLVLSQVSGPKSFTEWYPSIWSHVLSGGYPSLWSHVLSGGTLVLAGRYPRKGYPQPGQDWGTPPAGTGVPLGQDRTGVSPWDWLHYRRYASCGFPQENFLLLTSFDL